MIHSPEFRSTLNTAVRLFAESGMVFKEGIIYVLIHLLHRTSSKQVRALSGRVRQPMIIIALINFASSVIFLASENFWSCCLRPTLAELQPASPFVDYRWRRRCTPASCILISSGCDTCECPTFARCQSFLSSTYRCTRDALIWHQTRS